MAAPYGQLRDPLAAVAYPGAGPGRAMRRCVAALFRGSRFAALKRRGVGVLHVRGGRGAPAQGNEQTVALYAGKFGAGYRQ